MARGGAGPPVPLPVTAGQAARNGGFCPQCCVLAGWGWDAGAASGTSSPVLPVLPVPAAPQPSSPSSPAPPVQFPPLHQPSSPSSIRSPSPVPQLPIPVSPAHVPSSPIPDLPAQLPSSLSPVPAAPPVHQSQFSSSAPQFPLLTHPTSPSSPNS